MDKRFIIISAFVGLVLCVGLLWFALKPVNVTQSDRSRVRRPSDAKPVETVAVQPVEEVEKGVEKPKRSEKRPKKGKEARRFAFRTVPSSLMPEEQALADSFDEVVAENDLRAIVKASKKLAASTNAQLRAQVVSALGFFGKDALAELTPFMADADKEVAESAIGQVELAIQGIEDHADAFLLSASYANTFTDNEDAFTMLTGIMSMSALQVVEPDDSDDPASVEKARRNRAEIVQSLEALMQKGGKAAEHARDVFETVTGEAWSGPEAADAWVEKVAEE